MGEVRLLTGCGTAHEPHKAPTPSTSEIASAIVRPFFTSPPSMAKRTRTARPVQPRHDEGADTDDRKGTPGARGSM